MKLLKTCLIVLVFTICKVNAKSFGIQKDSTKYNTKNFAIAVGVGSTGYSLTLHHQFSHKIGCRLGYSKGSVDPIYVTTLQGNLVEVKGDFNFEMLNFFVDYFPIKKYYFKITAGISNNFSKYALNINPLTSQSFGYIQYPPEQIGTLTAHIRGLKYAPYFGIGFGKDIPIYKLGLGMDIGLYFYDSPKFSLTTTGSFGPSNNEKNIKLLEHAFRDWKYYPLVNFHVTYRIAP